MGQALGCVTTIAVTKHLDKPVKVLHAGRISLPVQQLDVRVDTKTKDNIFVTVAVSVQYRALAKKASDSFSMLSNTNAQLKAHALGAIRAAVQGKSLADIVERQDEISMRVQKQINNVFSDWGFEILHTIITDIQLDEFAKQCFRMKMMDDYKIHSKLSDSTAVVRCHEAILKGIPGTSTKDAVDIILINEYMNTMKAVGASSKAPALSLPLHPGAFKDAAAAQIRESALQAEGAGHSAI